MKFLLHLFLAIALLGGGLTPVYAQRGGGFMKGGGKSHSSKGRSHQKIGRKGKHRSFRTKDAGSEISSRYKQGERGHNSYIDLGQKVADRVRSKDYFNDRNHITWHEAARSELYPAQEIPVSAMYAEDIFLGNISLSALTPKEQTEFLLAEIPGLIVEGEMLPTAQVWKDILQEYRTRSLAKSDPARQANPVDYWVEQMSVITNLGFFGSAGDELFVMAAALNKFPLNLQPLTDVITVRALLNLDAKQALNDFVDMRLSQVDGKGRPVILPAVWREFPWDIVKRIPNSRIEPGGNEKGISIDPGIQGVLGRYNSYNLIHLDPSFHTTEDFLNLRRGMKDKINDYVLSGQASGKQLSDVLQYRLQRTFEETQIMQTKYGVYVPENLLAISSQWVEGWTELGELSVAAIYPHAPTYLTEDSLLDYMLAKQNMEARKWYPKMYAQYQRFYDMYDLLVSSVQPITHPASQDMAWLAGQASGKTKYLILGNINVKNWENYTLRMMQTLRRQYPGRQIILMDQYGAIDTVLWTMFDGPGKTGEDLLNIVTDVTESSVLKEDMDVRRLENPLDAGLLVMRTQESNLPFENTLEGLRITSQAYMQQINRVRTENPDALIVLSVNRMLADYSVPYSLGSQLYGPQTFVAQISTRRMGETLFEETIEPIEAARSAGVDIDEAPALEDLRILQFRGTFPAANGLPATPMNRAVGFDARILLSEN